MEYNGIELTAPAGAVHMSHSRAFDIIRGEDSSQNMDWTDLLGNLPWGELKGLYPDAFDNACRLFSLMQMDYHVCNGGVEQYFFNGYHEDQDPMHDNDVAIYGIEEQKKDFNSLLQFARELFPDRNKENLALERAAAYFEQMEYEKDALVYETVYCDEDEYVLDEETGELVENEDYFEPYEDSHYEDVIHGGDEFERTFCDASEYFEELLELRAQFYCKQFAREFEKHGPEHPGLTAKVKELLPHSAFTNFRKSADQVHSVSSIAGSDDHSLLRAQSTGAINKSSNTPLSEQIKSAASRALSSSQKKNTAEPQR